MNNIWIPTFTGVTFFPFNPDPGQVRIVDIAYHLGRTCRFGGAVSSYYSVAEHSVILCDLLDDEQHKKYALLHDASEAYLNDIRRPIRAAERLRWINDAHFNLQAAIYQRFGLHPAVLPRGVSTLDDLLLINEAHVLMREPSMIEGYNRALITKAITDQIKNISPDGAAKLYLRRFVELF